MPITDRIQKIITEETDESKLNTYTQTQIKVRDSWENIYKSASDTVRIVSSTVQSTSTESFLITSYAKLYAVADDGSIADYSDDTTHKVEITFNNAIKKYKTYNDAQTALLDNENEINILLLPESKSPAE